MNDRATLDTKLGRLAALLKQQGVIATDDLAIERQFTAGQSNPTYLLRSGERRLVLRKQPYGHLLPKAHDVVREHAIVDALAGAGFRVPTPLFASSDRAIIGTAFFVMAYVPGIVHSNAQLPDVSATERGAIFRATAETLADLHGIDPAVLARAGIQPRGSFIERQIGAWRNAYRAAMTEADERIETVAQTLLDRRPQHENLAIAQGDFRLENLIFDGTSVAAVLDWELCTIGEPLCDLAYCCLWYHFPPEVLNGLAGLDLAKRGIPGEREFLDLYSARSGIDAHASQRYFLAFAFYRLAAILQGVYRRALDGNAASALGLERGRIARLCLDKAEQLAM